MIRFNELLTATALDESITLAAIRTFHRTIQSVGATGGVYKGQGRIRRRLMTCTYKEFLVEDQ